MGTSSLHLTFQSQPINFHRATISITLVPLSLQCLGTKFKKETKFPGAGEVVSHPEPLLKSRLAMWPLSLTAETKLPSMAKKETLLCTLSAQEMMLSRKQAS